jgi:MraZ protein
MALLFTGLSENTIDSKLRLAIPAKYRAQIDPERDGSAWYCVPWPGGALRLYPERTFESLAGQGPGSLTPGTDEAILEQHLFGFAERLEMDGQGRITVPKRHLSLAGLRKPEVVVIGAKNRLEVRDGAEWAARYEQEFAKLQELVERIEAKRARGG